MKRPTCKADGCQNPHYISRSGWTSSPYCRDHLATPEGRASVVKTKFEAQGICAECGQATIWGHMRDWERKLCKRCARKNKRNADRNTEAATDLLAQAEN